MNTISSEYVCSIWKPLAMTSMKAKSMQQFANAGVSFCLLMGDVCYRVSSKI